MLLDEINKPEIPSLNGIRAVSAGIVVAYHLGFKWMHGGYGVTAFFVLSGFLITHLLLKESERTGTISLRGFYFRRTLRIFPAFYVFCAVYVAMRLILHRYVIWPEVISSLTYSRDFYEAFRGSPNGLMKHTWSLAVEEQFYLLWPFIFCRFSPRQLLRGLAVVVVGVWAYRILLLALGSDPMRLYYAFDTRADSLAFGCLLAVAVHLGYEFRWLLRSYLFGPLLVVSILAVNVISKLHWRLDFEGSVVYGVLTILCGLLILHAIHFSEHPVYRILNNPVANYLGLISYPIYLYHVMIGHAFGGKIIGALAIVSLASLSYYIVEKPFLRIKDRLRPSGDSSSRVSRPILIAE